MAIRRLKVSNFRSFNELDVELGDFNVLIGANASGKSNFVEVFRFLRDIRKEGLRNAVALQGGSRYMHNLRLGTTKALGIEISDIQKVTGMTYDTHHGMEFRDWVFPYHELTYSFSIDAASQNGRTHRDGWRILDDSVVRKFTVNSEYGDRLGEIDFLVWLDAKGLHNRVRVDTSLEERIEGKPLFRIHLPNDSLMFPQDRLLFESEYFNLILQDPDGFPTVKYRQDLGYYRGPLRDIDDMGIYCIEAKASQQARTVRAPAALTEEASNLVQILDRILADKDQRKTLLNLVRFLLPYINDVGVQDLTDGSLLFNVSEKYTTGERIPASLISEGTIAAIALVVVLYFEDSPLVVFEEPDRGMHPKLMSRVVEMMKEVSKEKQVIITTHHPEMVRYAGVENLLFVSRDKDGFSQISRPADKTMVKQFLANDIGLDQLYVDDLLEV